MQPRQRSKWRAADGLHSSSPLSSRLIRWMRPRGESDSSPQSEYVGHAGRQNPQWTQVSTQLAGRGLSHRTPPPPAARAAATSGSDPVLARRRGGCRARSRPTMRVAPDARSSSIAAGASAGSTRWTSRPAAASRCSAHSASSSSTISPPTSVARLLGQLQRGRALEADEHVPRRPGVLDARRRQRLEHERIGRLGDDGARGSRQRVQAHAARTISPRRPPAPATSLRQVVARHVLDDPAAAVDDGAVGQPQRNTEQEIARQAVAVRARPGDG